MSCLVTDAEIVVRERYRQERIVRAQRVRVTRRIEAGAAAPAYVLRDERRDLLARLAAPVIGDVETADPLGVWSCGAPRQPRCWPDWRALVDWAAWSGLCLLAIAYAAIR
jgi:hypothetical protein